MSSLLRAHLAHLRRTGARPATVRDRVNTLIRLQRATGKDLAALNYDDLIAWQDGLRVAVASVCTYLAHVQSFYAWAVEYEHLDRNPARRLIRPRKPAMLPRPVPEEHVRTALRTAVGQVLPMLLLAAYLGLRAAEIAGVRREDVVHEGGGVYLRVHGKGGKERVVLIVPVLWEALRPWLSGGRGAVFLNTLGVQADGRFVTRAVSGHMQALGLPYTAHQFRHRFGTRLYAETRDLRLVQETMGHASADQTIGYVQMNPRQQSPGMRRLASDLPRNTRRRRRPDGGGSAASAA